MGFDVGAGLRRYRNSLRHHFRTLDPEATCRQRPYAGIAAAIQEGANAYLNRQYTTIAIAGVHYLPKGDARMIAVTPMIGGGGKTAAKFAGSKLKAGGDYSFFCSFPGHSGIMKGKLVVTK